MARTIEQLLAALRRVDPTTPEGRELVRSALVVKAAYAGVAVAAAAQLVGEHGLADLTPELTTAFTALCQPKRIVGWPPPRLLRARSRTRPCAPS
jgi:hypothetical protein